MELYATYPSLSGKTAIVTGGASGIGESITRQLVAQGVRVGFLDFAEEDGRNLEKDLPPGAAQFVSCDLRNINHLQESIAVIRAKFGPIAILVNNAARDDRHDMFSVTEQYWDERMATNLRHQFFAAQSVAGDMKNLGGGVIVNMGSVSWIVGQGGMVCYTTAKSAMQGLTRSLARDLGPDNIRVNCVLPGWTMTKRQIELWLDAKGEELLATRQCLKRKIYPDEIARAVLFFVSDDASACTSQSYIVDGGWV